METPDNVKHYNDGIERSAIVLDNLATECYTASGHANSGETQRKLRDEGQKFTGIANQIKRLRR